MGQHKYNPTAIKAKNEEFPPKARPISKREADRIMYAKCKELLTNHLLSSLSIPEVYK